MRSTSLFLVVLLAVSTNANWFDDFTDAVSDGLHKAGDFIKNSAAPAVEKGFNDLKEKAQDPEVHKGIREWVSDKYEKAKNFTNEEIVPELKKIYQASVKAGEDIEKEKESTTVSP